MLGRREFLAVACGALGACSSGPQQPVTTPGQVYHVYDLVKGEPIDVKFYGRSMPKVDPTSVAVRRDGPFSYFDTDSMDILDTKPNGRVLAYESGARVIDINENLEFRLGDSIFEGLTSFSRAGKLDVSGTKVAYAHFNQVGVNTRVYDFAEGYRWTIALRLGNRIGLTYPVGFDPRGKLIVQSYIHSRRASTFRFGQVAICEVDLGWETYRPTAGRAWWTAASYLYPPFAAEGISVDGKSYVIADEMLPDDQVRAIVKRTDGMEERELHLIGESPHRFSLSHGALLHQYALSLKIDKHPKEGGISSFRFVDPRTEVLASDGNYVALGSKSPYAEDKDIRVKSWKDGKEIVRFPGLWSSKPRFTSRNQFLFSSIGDTDGLAMCDLRKV